MSHQKQLTNRSFTDMKRCFQKVNFKEIATGAKMIKSSLHDTANLSARAREPIKEHNQSGSEGLPQAMSSNEEMEESLEIDNGDWETNMRLAYEDEMAREHAGAAKVLEAETRLAERVHNGAEVPVGRYRGFWNLYSPRYLELFHEKNKRYCRWDGDWEAGTLRMGSVNSLGGFDVPPDLGIEIKLPKFRFFGWEARSAMPKLASVQEQFTHAITEDFDSEDVWFTFLGDEMMKMRIGAQSILEVDVDGDVVFYGIRGRRSKSS